MDSVASGSSFARPLQENRENASDYHTDRRGGEFRRPACRSLAISRFKFR